MLKLPALVRAQPDWAKFNPCRTFGHVFKLDDRGAPVIPVFAVCSRCGKFERVIR